jgi:hypothetical protein
MKIKMAVAILAVTASVVVMACGNKTTAGAATAPAGSTSAGNSAATGTATTTTSSAPTGTPEAAANGSSAAVPAGAADFGPLKQVQIFDPVFNMVAYTISIPASWNFEGAVLRGPGCQTGMIQPVFRAYSPDMQYGMQQIPTSNYFWSDDKSAMPKGPDCKILQPMSAEDYGRLVLVSVRPGSVVDSVEVSPNQASFQANLEKSNQMLAQQAASVGNRNPVKVSGQAELLHIHYDLNGHAEQEDITVSISVADEPTSVIVSRPGQVLQTAIKHVMASSPYLSGERAPQGQMQSHLAAFKAIGATFKANPDFNAKYAAFMQDQTNKMIAASWAVTNSILAKGAAEGAQRSANAQAFIANMQKQGDARNANFNAQMAAKDAHTKDVTDYILDQQLYVNPTTGQTQTQSNQYNHTYSNGTATVQTNSATPPTGNWTELQPIKHGGGN